MQQIGLYEAKNRLSELIARVGNGESFTITKHGNPIAQLIPARGVGRRHPPSF